MCDPKHDEHWDHSRQTHDIPSFSWVTDVYFHQRNQAGKPVDSWYLLSATCLEVGPFNPKHILAWKTHGFLHLPKKYQPTSMASINVGGWHLPQKKSHGLWAILYTDPIRYQNSNHENTIRSFPSSPKKYWKLSSSAKKQSPPPFIFSWFSFKAYRLRPEVTQGQIGPSQFGSGDDTFHFTSFLLGATHGHPVTWLKPWGRQLDQKSCHNSNGCVQCVHPRKLTWNPKIKVWKMKVLSKWVIFRFHVSFRGCIS